MDAFEQIAQDRSSGSAELARRSAAALKALAQDQPQDCHQLALDAARIVLRAHPSMAGLVNLHNDALLAVSDADSPSAALIDACDRFVAALDRANERIARHALEILKAHQAITTISYSSTVAACLETLHYAGLPIHVYCLEARPLCEGRDMAARLSARGIGVTLLVDAAAYAALRSSTACLLGADSITPDGIVNKTGSAALAAIARQLERPCHVVTDLSKLWPPGLPDPPIDSHPREEIWAAAPEAIRVENRHFELVGWDAITGLISDQGMLDRDAVAQMRAGKVVDGEIARLVRTGIARADQPGR